MANGSDRRFANLAPKTTAKKTTAKKTTAPKPDLQALRAADNKAVSKIIAEKPKSMKQQAEEAAADPGKFLDQAVAEGRLKAGFVPLANPVAAGAGIAGAISSLAGRSVSASQLKTAATTALTSTTGRNAAIFTGTVAAGSAAVGPGKEFLAGVGGSSAAPVTRPTTTGGSNAGIFDAKDGRVWTPAEYATRPGAMGGSPAVPTGIGGSSLPADVVTKPSVTGTPARVSEISSTADGARTGTGTATGTATGTTAVPTPAAPVNSPAAIPVPDIASGVTSGAAAASAAAAAAAARTAAATNAITVARDAVRNMPPVRVPPPVPKLPVIGTGDARQGPVQSNWQDYRR